MYTARAAAAAAPAPANATVGGSQKRSHAKYPLQPPLEASPPESPTASTASVRSTSLYSHSFEDRPHSRDEDVLSSSTLYSGAHGHFYHSQMNKDALADSRTAFSITPSDQAEEQSRRSSHGTAERTLRRTPRSRRIESPVQLDGDMQTANRSGAATWDQAPSPESNSSGSTALSQNSYTVTSRQHDESSSAPNNEVKSKAETDDHQVVMPRRRGRYPLQEPASATSLRSLPTPPPSPTRQRQLESTEKEREQGRSSAVDTSSKQMRRRKYPLQAPASVTDLHNSHMASVSEGDEHRTGDRTPDKNDQSKSEEQMTPNSASLRRQKYPLQDPASIRDPKSAQPQSAVEDKDTATRSQSSDAQPKNSDQTSDQATFRRQVYPLQASAGTTDVPDIQVQSPTSPEERKDDQNATTNPFDRQIYPPQAPALGGDVQQSQLPPPKEVEVKQDDHASTEKPAQADGPTTLDPSKWQRKGYPMHTSQYRAPSPRPVTPDPHSRPSKQGQSPILLPKNIPAVRDAQETPPTGRTIVVCLDGTGDQFDSDNSNIVHLVSALKKDDPMQVTYYQAGIGTYGSGGLSSGFEAAADMAVGSGLGLHVRDAYHFLMHSYKEGDKICIFGFSRGAYTARCLAGMVHKVGLLPPRNLQQIYFAYKFYKDDSPDGWTNSADFKRTFCIDVSVYFIGCFDSVASVGIIPRQLPLSSTPTSKPRYFRHAMALDERRAKFKVCRHTSKSWTDIDEEAAKLSHHESHRARNHPNLTDEEYERIAGPEPAFDSDVLEVWFAGAHADIGGGAVKNVERHKLAQIPLRWMIRQAFECDTGILFQTKVLAEHGLDIHTLWPKYSSLPVPTHGPPPSFLRRFATELPPRTARRGKLKHSGQNHHNGEPLYHFHSPDDDDWTPEQVEDFYDALTPLNDQLVQAPSWWILEAWPVQYKIPTVPGKCITRTGMNWGQYRGVEDAEPKIHWTVGHRAQQLDEYRVAVRTAKGVKWQTVV